jgi:pSer/pThr/pTyr-binding forkhead associated (FHA) protein
VPESLLGLLKLCLLALVYLFFARVLWAVWSEVRATPRGAAAATASGGADSTKETTGRPERRKGRARTGAPSKLVGVQPPAVKGQIYLLGGEINIGRSPGCAIRIPEDTFMSSIHARMYMDGGEPFIQDLQSKNGTFVNGARISTSTRLARGDRVQVGSTLLEVD